MKVLQSTFLSISPLLALALISGFSMNTVWAVESTATQVGSASGPENDFTPKLQAYFTDKKKTLGELEPWQSKLFDEEAIPEYQRFIRDYHSEKAAKASSPLVQEVSAEIDFESLRNFLKFYAPKYLKKEKSGDLPALLVILKPQLSCAKCTSVLPGIKAMVAARLERRGLRALWATASELTSARSMGNDYQNLARHLAVQKKAMGVLLLSWQEAQADDLESAHADEIHYLIRSFFSMGELISTEASLDVSENGNFERAGGKLLADAFTELGAGIKKTELAQSELGRTEVSVEVLGWRGVEEYRKLKAQIEEALKGIARVDDFRIARGKAVLLVHSDSTAVDIHKQLVGLKVDGFRFLPVTLSDQRIHVEVAKDAKGDSIK